jgi:hypothetical protein
VRISRTFPSRGAQHQRGSWVEPSKKAPCPEKLYEIKGRCYPPAAKMMRGPRAIKR